MDNFAYKTLAVVASPVKRIVGTDACWAYSVHVVCTKLQGKAMEKSVLLQILIASISGHSNELKRYGKNDQLKYPSNWQNLNSKPFYCCTTNVVQSKL